MDSKRILSFQVLANGSIDLVVAHGHKIAVSEQSPNRLRITAVAIEESSLESRGQKFRAAAAIGTLAEDGTIYAGVSPTSGRPFFVSNEDRVRQYQNYQRPDTLDGYLQSAKHHGLKGWRLATPEEVAHLCANATAKSLRLVMDLRIRNYWAQSADGSHVVVNRDGEELPIMRTARAIAVRYG
jgi:hypothetical protein